MKLSSNFSLRELTKSQTAERKGIDNTPTEEHTKNLKHVHEDVEKLGSKISAELRQNNKEHKED